MATQVTPYLDFDGRCEEALEFYRTALDAKIDALMRYKDAPPGNECPPDEAGNMTPEHVMHSSFRVGDSVIMASDCYCKLKGTFAGFSLAITLKTEEEVNRYFAALEAGGKVVMPLEKTFWSPRFGTVTDKFGVTWMLMVAMECNGS